MRPALVRAAPIMLALVLLGCTGEASSPSATAPDSFGTSTSAVTTTAPDTIAPPTPSPTDAEVRPVDLTSASAFRCSPTGQIPLDEQDVVSNDLQVLDAAELTGDSWSRLYDGTDDRFDYRPLDLAPAPDGGVYVIETRTPAGQPQETEEQEEPDEADGPAALWLMAIDAAGAVEWSTRVGTLAGDGGMAAVSSAASTPVVYLAWTEPAGDDMRLVTGRVTADGEVTDVAGWNELSDPTGLDVSDRGAAIAWSDGPDAVLHFIEFGNGVIWEDRVDVGEESLRPDAVDVAAADQVLFVTPEAVRSYEWTGEPRWIASPADPDWQVPLTDPLVPGADVSPALVDVDWFGEPPAPELISLTVDLGPQGSSAFDLVRRRVCEIGADGVGVEVVVPAYGGRNGSPGYSTWNGSTGLGQLRTGSLRGWVDVMSSATDDIGPDVVLSVGAYAVDRRTTTVGPRLDDGALILMGQSTMTRLANPVGDGDLSRLPLISTGEAQSSGDPFGLENEPPPALER